MDSAIIRGYLLDTSVASAIWDAGHPAHGATRERILTELGPDAELFISTITLGEIEFGLAATNGLPEDRRSAIRHAASAHRIVLDVTRHVTRTYGTLRSALYHKYAPKKDRKTKRPESLIDPITSLELGIQENDLWLYSTALTHNLVFVTRDAMHRLGEVGIETFPEFGESILLWPTDGD